MQTLLCAHKSLVSIMVCFLLGCFGESLLKFLVCGMTPFLITDAPDQFYRFFLPLFIHAG
jgi:hypothetical protein